MKHIAFISLFILLTISTTYAQNRKINIFGKVYYNNSIADEATISVKDRNTNKVLSSVNSGNDGFYSISFFTNDNEPKIEFDIDVVNYNKRGTKSFSYSYTLNINKYLDGQSGLKLEYNLYANKNNIEGKKID